jgi:hypothetical protein
MEGEIGGHCLQSNAVILHESGERAITPIVLKEGQILSPSENPLENKTWLYCEYHGKKKSLQEIGDSIERTGENIGQWMRKHNIKRRDRTWTDEDLNKIIELHKKGLTFKEIADEMEDRTYESVRNIAYKVLDLDSNYNPGIRDEKTRQKISASLQGIEQKEWEEFKENANSLIRKSCQYIEWRDNVYKRDNYICQKCKDKSKTYFHAHHIKSFAKYPELRFDINNGITLCVECHKKEHFPNDKD